MDLVDYLRIVRRRWRPLAVLAVLVGVAAFLTAPGAPGGAAVTAGGSGYHATATLLQSPDTTQGVNIPLTRFYITTGEIPKLAAKALHYHGDPAVLATRVTVGGDDKIGSITIDASDAHAAAAAARANAFARATIDYLRSSSLADEAAQVKRLQSQLAGLRQQIDGVEAHIVGTAPSVLTAQRDALVQRYSAVYNQLAAVQSQPPASASLTILQRATPIPVRSGVSQLSAPRSPAVRTLLAVVVALVLAAGVVLVVERFDTRLRTRAAVEEAFRMPVVAEIPLLHRSARRVAALTTRRAPHSATAEGYRALRSALSLMPSLPVPPPAPADAGAGAPAVATSGVVQPQVVLVTSPTPQSGKTRTAANLAACLAEAGKSVLLLDCDVRNPSLHRYFDVDAGRGLADLVVAARMEELETFARPTNVRGVSLVTTGATPAHPTMLLTQMTSIVAAARRLADVVVVDGPPVIGTSDALDLMTHVDSVVVVAWEGRTRREHAARTADLMSRLAVPALGVALVTAEAPASYLGARRASVGSRA